MSMRDMLNRAQSGPLQGPRFEDYAPKALRAVETAAVQYPSEPLPIPNDSDEVVKSFIEMGEMIAQSLEKMGNRCAEQGEARKAEWYNAARVARKKAEGQAREAGEYIDDLGKLRAISEKPVAVITTPEPIPQRSSVAEPPKPELEKHETTTPD